MGSNRIKLSLIVSALALALLIITYIYSLWSEDRRTAQELPVDGVSAMMRDLLSYHEKRGGFPEDLGKLEGVVWDEKVRRFSLAKHAISHRNYFYFYSRLTDHRFTIWAIPTGKRREESPTWFLAVSPETCRRFKGGALPLEQISQIEANPPLKSLGIAGMIEQSPIDFRSDAKSVNSNFSRSK